MCSPRGCVAKPSIGGVQTAGNCKRLCRDVSRAAYKPLCLSKYSLRQRAPFSPTCAHGCYQEPKCVCRRRGLSQALLRTVTCVLAFHQKPLRRQQGICEYQPMPWSSKCPSQMKYLLSSTCSAIGIETERRSSWQNISCSCLFFFFF